MTATASGDELNDEDLSALRYPQNRRVSLDESKDWPETLRVIRTCQYCRKIYRHAGAAVTCEHSHHRRGTLVHGRSK